MKIAITDANIFIDLIHIELQAELFAADLEIHTTFHVIDELNKRQQEVLAQYIQEHKLTIHPWNDDSLSLDIPQKRNLSPSDKSVLSVAMALGAFILTGDGLLRKISGFQMIEVHGILWLFDRFVELKLVAHRQAADRLEKLMDYNKRLPVEDCMKRITAWLAYRDND